METIQSQLGPVISSEKEINNAVNYKVKRRAKIPEWVAIGKLRHAERLIEGGASLLEAGKAIGVADNTFLRLRKKYGVLDKNFRAPSRSLSVGEQKGKVMKVKKSKRGIWMKDPRNRKRLHEIAVKGGLARAAKKRAREAALARATAQLPRLRHRRNFTMTERMDLVRRAKELISSGQVRNMTEASKILGIHQSNLSIWTRIADKKIVRLPGRHRVGTSRAMVRHENGLTIKLTDAVGALSDVLSAQGVDSKSGKLFLLMYENSLLRKALS